MYSQAKNDLRQLSDSNSSKHLVSRDTRQRKKNGKVSRKKNQNKVKKISKGSFDELKQIYAKQLSKMSEFVFMPKMSDRVIFDQDMSPGARHFHLTMLPKNMQELLVRLWNQDGKWRDVEDVLRYI